MPQEAEHLLGRQPARSRTEGCLFCRRPVDASRPRGSDHAQQRVEAASKAPNEDNTMPSTHSERLVQYVAITILTIFVIIFIVFVIIYRPSPVTPESAL